MDFEFSKEQSDIKTAAREFAEGEFPKFARECDRKEEFPLALWEKACELGFVGVFIDPKYDGAGLGCLESAIIMEEFWRVDPGCGCVLLTSFGAEVLDRFGTEEQKRRYLQPIPSGGAIMGTAVTEPDAGSDIFGVRTTAVKEGDSYVLNGSKTFITNGSIADYLAVFCVTDPEAASRYERYSILMVEKERPGFEATKLKGKMGIRASDTAEIALNNVRIGKENLIGGEPGKGFLQIMELFNVNRIVAAAQGVGIAQGSLEKATQHVKKRKTFGRPVGSNQGIQFKLAEMATMIEASRLLYQKAGHMLDSGKVDVRLIAMAKWLSGEVGVRVTDDALQMHGGYGYFEEYDIERFYRDAKIVEIYEATKEMEKATIARKILGKM